MRIFIHHSDFLEISLLCCYVIDFQNSPSSCNNQNILKNDGSQNFATDILSENLTATTQLNINHDLMDTDSSNAVFFFFEEQSLN